MNIKDVLDKHGLWLKGDPKGERADLSEADLSRANLFGVKGIISFNLGQHQEVMWMKNKTKMVNIGCGSHELEEWLKNYKEIGIKNGYNENEIENYGLQLNILKKMAIK